MKINGQDDAEDVLQTYPASVAAPAAAERPDDESAHDFESRPEFAYMTLRGDEEDIVMLAVREESGNTLELLDIERRK